MILIPTTYFLLLIYPASGNGDAGRGIYFVYGFNNKYMVNPCIFYTVILSFRKWWTSAQWIKDIGVTG